MGDLRCLLLCLLLLLALLPLLRRVANQTHGGGSRSSLARHTILPLGSQHLQ
jgi:hypothetical protein